jgi:hypothetical protein
MSSRRLIGWLVACSLVVVLMAFSIQALFSVRNGRDETRCEANAQYLAFALTRFKSEFGCYPPLLLTDDRGRPVHNWRMLLTPYCEGMKIYESYDFAETWDSVGNEAVYRENGRAYFDRVFGCAFNRPGGSHRTRFVGVSGPLSFWTRASFDHADNNASECLLIEVSESQGRMLEPAPNFEGSGLAEEATAGIEPPNWTGRGSWFVTIDGKVNKAGKNDDLRTFLRSHSVSVGGTAVQAKCSAMVKSLRMSLQSKHWTSRQIGAMLLGELGHHAEFAVDDLQKTTADEDKRVRSAASRALVKIKASPP